MIVCVNALTLGVSEYAVDAVGVVSTPTASIVALPTGLYQVGVDGDTPAPVVTTGKLSFEAAEFNIPHLSALILAGEVSLETTTREQGREVVNGPYLLPTVVPDVVELPLETRNRASQYVFSFSGEGMWLEDMRIEVEPYIRRQV
jgi:hypothetical protein